MSGTTQIVLTPTVGPASGGAPVPHTTRTTVQDMIDYVVDFMAPGGDTSGELYRTAKRAVKAAARELANAHNWTYLYEQLRIQTNGFVSAGTVQYQNSSGTYPFQLTLTGATWPSWVQYGTLRFNTLVCTVDRVISSTVITLDPTLNPGPDGDVNIPAGSAYTLYRDTYTLPQDFVASDQGFGEVSWGSMQYVHPNQWLRVQRYYQSYSNTPRWFTFMGDPRVPGRLCYRVYPFPDVDRSVDMIYRRRPRDISLDNYSAGLASVDAVNSPQTITGSGTAWASSMKGCVIRLAADQSDYPTGFTGDYPAVLERNINLFVSSGNVQIDDLAPTSLTNVKYVISDPIDVEDGAMLEAYIRCCEKHASLNRSMKERQIFAAAYEEALEIAKEADNRNFSQRVAGMRGMWRQRLANMPIVFNTE